MRRHLSAGAGLDLPKHLSGAALPVDVHPQAEHMAMEPRALGRRFAIGFSDDDAPFDRMGNVGIICIDGPLAQRGGWCFDGYDAIKARFAAALGDPAVRCVVLKINSPGGVCAGCFEAASAMRAAKTAAGKPVLAFADESAFSAGYAMACVADEIYLPESGAVGSVGVLGCLWDRTAQNAADGLKVAIVTSGDQKADGHPDTPLTDDVVARFRTEINHLAGLFAGLVGDARSMTPADVLALQAGIFYGADAKKAGLADGVLSLGDFIRRADARGKAAARTAASAPARKETRKMGDENSTASGGNDQAGTLLLASISLAAVALAAGLHHGADEGTIVGRLSSLRETEAEILKLTSSKTVAEALGKVQGSVVAAGKLDEAQAELVTLRADHTKREVDGLMADAKREGKITTDDAEREFRAVGMASPERLRGLLTAMPVMVRSATSPTGTTEAAVPALTEEELYVARKMNLDPEKVAKVKAEQARKRAALYQGGR